MKKQTVEAIIESAAKTETTNGLPFANIFNKMDQDIPYFQNIRNLIEWG